MLDDDFDYDNCASTCYMFAVSTKAIRPFAKKEKSKGVRRGSWQEHGS